MPGLVARAISCLGHIKKKKRKNQPAKQEMQVISLGQDNTLEEEMATCSSILS